MFLGSFILKIRRAETPFYARLKRAYKAILTFQMPIPRALDPIFSLIRFLQILKYETEQKISVACLGFPILRTMCVSIGKRLEMEGFPFITGPVKVGVIRSASMLYGMPTIVST